MVFAVDSILVAVAMSPKTWVVITGGIVKVKNATASIKLTCPVGASASCTGSLALRTAEPVKLAIADFDYLATSGETQDQAAAHAERSSATAHAEQRSATAHVERS